MKLPAVRYDRQGSRRRKAGDPRAAILLFQKAIRHAPQWSVPWYNLGLTHKYSANWPESFRCNAEAVRLNPEDEAAIWNMGIAATALEDWSEARRAWGLFGIQIPEGTGPIEMDLGKVPIRINPDTDGEVVWAHRIDPARAVLTSIPLPESNHRHGDLVLHDGAPMGYRLRGDQDVPVFNELGLLAPSTSGTFETIITARTVDDLAAFEQACQKEGCPVEDWSTIRILCRECSEGRPHQHPEPAVEGEHRFAIAAPDRKPVERAVSAWTAADRRRLASGIKASLEPRGVH